MAAKRRFIQGEFVPSNKQKYVGKKMPKYRSSWELKVMHFFDQNPHIIQWASEAIAIQYKNPVTKKISCYFPDFLVVYQDAKGNTRAEMIEVKPNNQTSLEEARSKYDKAQAIINQAKWIAATAYCKKANIGFRIMTENEIFMNPRGRK